MPTAHLVGDDAVRRGFAPPALDLEATPATLREADAIAQVVRAFADEDIIHVDGKVDAKSDIGTINTELILAETQR